MLIIRFVLQKDSEDFLYCDIRNILEAGSFTASCSCYTYVAQQQIPWLTAQLCDPALLFSNKHSWGLPCIHLEASFVMPVFQTTPWRLISGTLGVVCLLLAATLGILLKNSKFHYTRLYKDQNAFSPGPITELQEDSDCCSCPEKWIGYRCNCYFISNGKNTWAESRNSCASQNSSLLYLKSRDELDFLKSSRYFYWIGLSYNETRGTWLWEDGSSLSQDLSLFSEILNPEECTLYGLSGEISNGNCKAINRYICKRQPI
nr:natural killer cells antigen CD94-like [Loxodonta africana]